LLEQWPSIDEDELLNREEQAMINTDYGPGTEYAQFNFIDQNMTSKGEICSHVSPAVLSNLQSCPIALESPKLRTRRGSVLMQTYIDTCPLWSPIRR